MSGKWSHLHRIVRSSVALWARNPGPGLGVLVHGVAERQLRVSSLFPGILSHRRSNRTRRSLDLPWTIDSTYRTGAVKFFSSMSSARASVMTTKSISCAVAGGDFEVCEDQRRRTDPMPEDRAERQLPNPRGGS